MRNPTIEFLERRRLMSGSFAAHINFQPATSAFPMGYFADSGAVFGDRGNGLTYGWNRPAHVLDRNIANPAPGTDQRYNTFAVMNSRHFWQIDVPSGAYQVAITAGDPNGTGSEAIRVNGVPVVHGHGTKAHRWVSGSGQVTVSAGVLKVTTTGGAASKIDFIDITQSTPTSGFKYDHIVVVVEENQSNSSILGPSATDDPYIQSLAGQGAAFTNSRAITHPSEPNYLALFSGSTQRVTDDTTPPPLTGNNLANQLNSAGLSFDGYSEDLPSVGFTGDTSGDYARKHNPWSDFTNVPASENLPFSQFPGDFTSLPSVAFVVPNLQNDMHDGTIAQGDQWLHDNIGAYAAWAQSHNSLLIVTLDENDGSPGNRIATVVVGAGVTPGTYTQAINHYSVLRTIEDACNLTPLGGARKASNLQLTNPS